MNLKAISTLVNARVGEFPFSIRFFGAVKDTSEVYAIATAPLDTAEGTDWVYHVGKGINRIGAMSDALYLERNAGDAIDFAVRARRARGTFNTLPEIDAEDME